VARLDQYDDRKGNSGGNNLKLFRRPPAPSRTRLQNRAKKQVGFLLRNQSLGKRGLNRWIYFLHFSVEFTFFDLVAWYEVQIGSRKASAIRYCACPSRVGLYSPT
jgi:hypothetical protein